MPVLLDTGVLYAYYDRSDDWHARALKVMRAEVGGLVVPSPVIPEVDHLLGRRLGAQARAVFYRALAEGHFFVVDLPRELYPRVAELNRQFSDLDLGFVDAAVAALAESLELRRVATTDRRHFNPLAARLELDLVP